ncbi:GumC domain-containing protein [Stappia indica]|uniref:hypothetical protein n=1 Tax=Stappia indica TaxID=538381 RepID=UPI001CD19F72|nr:hypothetical protein [Stappia indica]MCA1298038.1 hypothetical protein [Stappia indica]
MPDGTDPASSWQNQGQNNSPLNGWNMPQGSTWAGAGTFWGQQPAPGGGAATTQQPAAGTPAYQPTNTQTPLGQVDYRTNIMGHDGQTFTANSDPSNASQFGQNYLRPGFNMAQSYLNQGVGFNPFEGNRVAGFTPQQQAYFQGVQQQFGSTPGYQQSAENTVGAVAGAGGIAPGMQGDLNTLGQIASGANGITTGQQFQNQANNPLTAMQQGAGQFYQGAQQGFGPSYSEQNLADVAKGGGANPYFQDQLANQLDQVQSRINARMSSAGRYGSGAYGDAMARGLGATATDALSRNYEFEAGRQMQANQLMDQQRQQDIANRFTGAAGAANLGQNEIQNRMAALQGLTGTQQQNIANRAGAASQGMQGRLSAQQDALRAAALAPTMQQSQITRLNQLMNSGAIQQSQNQDEINAARDLYNEQQQAPWERLQAYMGTIGQPQSGSIGPQPQAPGGPSTAQSVLGGGLMGAQLGNAFGMPLLGGLAGGILGGLF